MVADPVVLRGLGFTEDGGFQAAPFGSAGPTLTKWKQADFVSRFLGQVVEQGGVQGGVQEGPGRVGLEASMVDVATDGLLFQPVHRMFYLATLEVVCDVVGQPRLSPDKIDSAGMVIRRVGSGAFPERWVDTPTGTQWYATTTSKEDVADPDSARRSSYQSGNAVIDARLAAANAGAGVTQTERSTRLFVASRAICETVGVGRTIVFGAVQLASSEVDASASSPSQGYTPDDIAAKGGLPHYFRAGANVSLGSVAGVTYAYADVTSFAASNPAMPKPLDVFVKMLQRMVAEFDLLGNGSGPLVGALNGLTLTYGGGGTRGAGDALVEAANLFVVGQSAVTVTMPSSWPSPTQAQAAAIAAAAGVAASGRLAQVFPQQGRFEVPGAQYQIRAFIRVKRDDGCPPALFWSDYTAPFTIAPWHQRCPEVPPVQISLPDVTPTNVKTFLPNVAFNVPPSIQNLLNANSPSDFLKGNASSGGSGGLAWICGFNIPIITLCAFIVLNIFLSLLNIVFWWMAFIKICIPVPAAFKAKLPNGSTS